MFEKEIEFIYNYNLNKIQHLSSFISYEQLISTDIHPALLQYISAEIDFLIYEDRQKLLQDSVFDYSSDKIIEHFTNIGEEIKKSKKFSLEYLTKLLLHASSFNVNFIIRPKWALLQFVFESESESAKPVVEVKQILNYLYYYPYLRRLLIRFFSKKRILTINSTELEELLVKIDKINYESNFSRVLDGALKNMAEFINIGGSGSNKISRQAIELFLEDKGLSQYKVILNEKFSGSETNKYEINDYKNVILSSNIEDETVDISEDEIINESMEDFQEVVSDEHEELNEEVLINSETQSDDENDIENNEDDESIEVEVNNEIVEKNEDVDLVDDERNKNKKSFLESYIDGLDEKKLKDPDDLTKQENEVLDSEIEEIEPPDFDEAPRVEDEIIDEAYEFTTEEEELDATVDEDSELDRVEIKEEEGDPFDDNDELKSNLEEEMEKSDEISSEKKSEGYIELGNSVTFSSDQLSKEEDTISKDDTLQDDDDWHTESSNANYNDLELDVLLEKSEVSNIPDKTDMEEILVEEEKVLEDEAHEDEGDGKTEKVEEETIAGDNSETKVLKEKSTSESENNFQEVLFSDDNFKETKEEFEDVDNTSEDYIVDAEKIVDEEPESLYSPSIDISVLLENKKITKIIEMVFDYDMEEFASAIEKISECKNEIEALATVDEIAKKLFIDLSSKEIKVFKNIISDFFK